ncbi:MAG TPA: 50S ribosomal protein L7/L12 [Syntrophomonadaceae bacterium]|nr:50S ribosomal protein L7/L12 [Syntrophomonadaceae bacterium]
MEYIVIGGALAVGILSLISSVNTLQKQVSLMNLKLDRIAKQIGAEEPNIDNELRSLIVAGKKVKAVKELRDVTGMGLKEAKEYVDKLL